MPNKRIFLLLLAALLAGAGAYYASGSHDAAPSTPTEEEGHGHDEEGHAEETVIQEGVAQELGITVEVAGPARIEETVSVTGRVDFNRNTTAQVKARFEGVIRSVLKEPGETVQAGATLATVESNDSLQVYPVTSPVTGTIVSRTAAIGELAGDAPLFVVADLDTLWAELFVFSRDGEKLQAGQKVRIQCLDDPASSESTIALILPAAEASSQTVVARAIIDNAGRHWRAGMNIRADVVLSEREAALAVRSDALQRMDGKTVVFVQVPDGAYAARPVKTGASDGVWTEVLGGLTAGERYVAKNSFVVRADIEKASAEHEH